MEDTVRNALSFCTHSSSLTVMVQFDRYLASRQQEEPQNSTGAVPGVVSEMETLPPLFGDNQLARARMMRAARDAKKGLDPRAELRLYLDEPLHEGNLSPMGWWKVSPYPCSEIIMLKTG